MESTDWGPIKFGMVISGLIAVVFFTGIVLLFLISRELSISNQAQILATVLGSMGTLLLALATYINIFQTNRSLELRKKARKKPLVVDELSNVIQPSITSLEKNLNRIRDSDDSGCTFDWVYIEKANQYTGTRAPEPTRTTDNLAMSRLASENKDLYRNLRAHNRYISQIGEKADMLHTELEPEIERLLDAEGIDSISQSLKVITSAVLKEVDHFGEDHELYDFWESNGESFITYANENTSTTVDEIQAAEEEYRELTQETLKQLKQRKEDLKREFRISEDEITIESERDVFDII